ncbi:hypothetical protein PHLCEN_2v6987 [Hermanssonia centrifuga]|uniref:Uncharacterized protein n=1 Tax=Hermanssonia centrifuga TaxID=98765 RepID=A0A2R6NXT3_9APHY|nr:hypothetical protein PHLCEN_2v6987 [Hermanssonia centrifuga]
MTLSKGLCDERGAIYYYRRNTSHSRTLRGGESACGSLEPPTAPIGCQRAFAKKGPMETTKSQKFRGGCPALTMPLLWGSVFCMLMEEVGVEMWFMDLWS